MLTIAEHWWVPTLRGIAAILFGILAWAVPHVALTALLVVFGLYAIADGIIALAGLFRADSNQTPWFLQLLVGIAGIGAGVITFAYPGITAVTLLAFVAAWAIVSGLAEIFAAIQQKTGTGAIALGVGGCVSTLFGVLMLARPFAGALALAWVIGAYAIIAGIALVTMGTQLYRIKQHHVEITAGAYTPEEYLTPERESRVER